MIIRNRLALSATLAASILLGACSSTPLTTPVAAKDTAQTSSTAAPAKPAGSAAVVAPAALAAYLDPQNVLYKERSVYFDFDQSTLKPEGVKVIEQHGKYQASQSPLSIPI